MVANSATWTKRAKSLSRVGRKEGNMMNEEEVKVRIDSLHAEGDELRPSLMLPLDGLGPSDVSTRLNKWITNLG